MKTILRSWLGKVTPTLAMLALPLLIGACSATGPGGRYVAPDADSLRDADAVPSAIAAPAGQRLAFVLRGRGFQHYECRSKGSASDPDWAFVVPEAALRDTNDVLVGKHWVGPTWEHADGSLVTGRVVANVPASQAADIPWLLLKTNAAAKPGQLAGVTYIERINTSGGTAPTTGCTRDTVGRREAVRYTADYLFFKG